jgi:hypothetical protein
MCSVQSVTYVSGRAKPARSPADEFYCRSRTSVNDSENSDKFSRLYGSLNRSIFWNAETAYSGREAGVDRA